MQVFSYDDVKPEKHHADTSGMVLQFHPQHGWHQGNWMFRVWTDTTHWMPLPARPCDKDPKVEMEDRFNIWVKSFPDGSFDATALSFMRLGWNAGYTTKNRDF